jgi:DNA-binding transcriptional MerR regulator
MDNHYTTKDMVGWFQVSHETVKNWASEFARHLSPSATPPAGSKRTFTDDDVKVFALVADHKKRGLTYADAHVALDAGQRGEIPSPTAEIERLPAAVQNILLRLRSEMDDLHSQLETEKANTHRAEGQVELLKEQLVDKDRQIRTLLEENAELKARHKPKSGS